MARLVLRVAGDMADPARLGGGFGRGKTLRPYADGGEDSSGGSASGSEGGSDGGGAGASRGVPGGSWRARARAAVLGWLRAGASLFASLARVGAPRGAPRSRAVGFVMRCDRKLPA